MKYLSIIILFLFVLLVEVYAYQAVRVYSRKISIFKSKILKNSYWAATCLTLLIILSYIIIGQSNMGVIIDTFLRAFILINIFSKLTLALFVLIDDGLRVVKWVFKRIQTPTKAQNLSKQDGGISRSDFLIKTGLVVAAAPVITMSWGIISRAHDYRIRREKIPIPHLPSAFQGLKIAQISDIHSGSFWNKTAVKGGVEMLMEEKADLVLFTGDLVNNKSSEMQDWGIVFNKISAPLGVYSVLGNHDYGDYEKWPSIAAKEKNLKDLIKIQEGMGWKLLKNEHTVIKIDGEKLGIIGVENWGAAHNFPKYGNLTKAMQGLEVTAVNILLSHDPTHWRAEVLPKFSQIDLTLSGHTHGMQFGVEVPGFKWSPAEYLYKEWAGLYKDKNQYLYVNRGFGYIGYPGRIGILPEITILELQKA